MNAEKVSLVDHSYLPQTSLAIAQKCVGVIPFIDHIPDGVEISPKQDIRHALTIRHNGPNREYGGTDENPIFWPAYYFLIDAKCPLTDIERVIDVHSQLVEPVFKSKGEDFDPTKLEFEAISDIYALSLDELQIQLEKRLSPLYALANLSLDSEFEHGFNRHGLEDHIRVIADRTVQLLKDLGYDEMTQKIGMIMAYAHDLGNVLTRKFHSLASPYLLEKYVPELLVDTEYWKLIVQGIELHNEPVASAYTASLKERGMTSEQAYASLHPTIAALIAADKTHIDPDRVSKKVKEILSAMNNDDHVEVNYLLTTISAGMEEEGVYVWRMQKERTMSTEENEAFIDFMKSEPGPNQKSVAAFMQLYGKPTSGYTHEEHKKNRVLHIDTLDTEMWAVYYERINLLLEALFGIQAIKEVRIIIDDDDLKQFGEGITHVFTRENKEDRMKQQLVVAEQTRAKKKLYKDRK